MTHAGANLTQVSAGDVAAMAVDDDGVYWGDHGTGAISGNAFWQRR